MAKKLPGASEDYGRLLRLAERIIKQSHYGGLSDLEPAPLSEAERALCAGDIACLFRIKELVFNSSEGPGGRLSTVLNALHSCGASCLLLLQCMDGRCELCIGAVNKARPGSLFYLNTIRDVLRSGLEGNLPGTELQELVTRGEIEQKLEQCLGSGFDSQCVTSISCVAGEPEAGAPVRGIERLLEAMDKRNFTLLLLADPVDAEQISSVCRGYEDLSTQLSSLGTLSVSQQSGTNLSSSRSSSTSVSRSISRNLSMTQSHSSGVGRSLSANSGEARQRKLLSIGAGLMTGNLLVSGLVSNLLALPQDSESWHEDASESMQESLGSSEQESVQEGLSRSMGLTRGTTVSYTASDRRVKDLLDRIEAYLGWLNSRESLGMFSCCAYVISSSAGTNLMVASQYQALMQGRCDMPQPVAINTWTRENGVGQVKLALRRLCHPRFICPELDGEPDSGFTPAMLLSSDELSRHMALPQHSVVGISTMEYASFGREVVRKTPLRSGRVLRVGCVSHMGRLDGSQPVLLDLQSLAAHTFVAGTNGSGKSNTVFRLLEELQKASVPFMVIEPAKGEYKNVFGGDEGVRVYGTNRRRAPLLRLNPFWFNDDVAVLEHIDKMIGVFNASWPMYAAMPAVLKAAIEGAYTACGWDLAESVCRGGRRIFPTVQDVLEQFRTRMDSTAFSEEVKGNYVGALSTRMESLCNGIYGEIFGGGNLSDEELFDRSVIIDLSRVGSTETKAMIMGMLVIRLQEYRMRSEAMNLPLRHVTVLEEAHHLLRRSSAFQGGEGGSVLGMSVEMLSNAIAEMRSYGEGFIIVDQSPGLLDMSVMRNTNTKLILRLPEAGDRELVGGTIGLKPEQVYELSRLKTGTCAVYQKDWLEAVLCRVDRAGHEERPYVPPAEADEEQDLRRRLVRCLLAPDEGRPREGAAELAEAALACGVSGGLKLRLVRELGAERPDARASRSLACALAGLPLRLPCGDPGAWYAELCGDERLQARWGGDLPRLIRLSVGELADESEDWRAVLERLPDTEPERTEQLKLSRGLAFSRTCPLYCKAPPLGPADRAQLERAAETLSASHSADRLLAMRLRRSLELDEVRSRDELSPYTELVWGYAGGRRSWDELYPLLESGRLDKWDARARALLSRRISADERTMTSLLSLFLQCMGGSACVKARFPEWFRLALARGAGERR